MWDFNNFTSPWFEEIAAFLFCTFFNDLLWEKITGREQEEEKHYATVSSIFVSLEDVNMESEAGFCILKLLQHVYGKEYHNNGHLTLCRCT